VFDKNYGHPEVNPNNFFSPFLPFVVNLLIIVYFLVYINI
jgi:hypothetical protein